METVYWLAQRAANVPGDEDWLSPGEAQILAGLHFAKRRGDWRLGRWVAKCAVSEVLLRQDTASGGRAEADLRRVEILAGESGAPEVRVDGVAAGVSISLSHAGGTASCAVATAGVAIGCDVEVVEPRSNIFVRDYFTAAERQLIGASPLHRHDLVVTLLWSAKESALKALQQGLRLDTREVEVVYCSAAQGALAWHPLEVRHRATGAAFCGWWQSDAEIVHTILAAPPPAMPVALAQVEPRKG
jgi:4'-phosphopantetheinyl transferase